MEFLSQFSWLEWFAFITSMLYTWLAAKENSWCWFFGGIGAAAILVLCIQGKLYSEAVLQVYYIGISVYGWLTWTAHVQQIHRPVQRMHMKLHAFILVAGFLGLFALGAFWKLWGAALPYLDATTTSFSILATWLVARKYLESWIYFIVIDLISIYLYASRGMQLLSFLFVVYTILAVYAFVKWRKMSQLQTGSFSSN